MKVTFFGTRGSLPVAGADIAKYGGRTTCVRIESVCLPRNHCLVVDAGTGIYPLGMDAAKNKVENVTILFTHYHWDHIQGLPLTPITFRKDVSIHCLGPMELGVGPEKMLEVSMAPPFFPVDYRKVASHFHWTSIDNPGSYVTIIHPEGGQKMMTVDQLERTEKKPAAEIAINGAHYKISECLIIRMLYSNHPERTISYRFEERPTGKVFVFLTDHENTDGLAPSTEMIRHLVDADLLVMDSQYSRNKYESMTVGFGHGTPDYCTNTAHKVNAKRLGLTHHDPAAKDKDIELIIKAAYEFAQKIGYSKEIFACADDMTIEV